MSDQPSSSHTAYRAVLLAAALLVLGLLFRQLLTLMLAVLITVILAIALSAVATPLERRFRVPRAIGTLIALLLGLGIVAGIFALIIPPFIEQTNDFINRIPRLAANLQNQVHDLTGLRQDEITKGAQEFTQRYTDNPGRLIGPIASIGLGLAGAVGALVLILITAFYMAVRPDPLLHGLRRLVPPGHRPRVDMVIKSLRSSWIGWMQGVSVDMLVSGILLYIGLTILGVDYAIFFAVLSALLVLIPYFGAVAGGLFPTLFALTDSPGKALLVMAVYTLVQQIEGNVTIPLVMSKTTRLHPAVIAVGVVIVGQLFGFIGLIVAVPILSLVVILVEEVWVKPMESAHAASVETAAGPADPPAAAAP